jgi:hypothetical protein
MGRKEEKSQQHDDNLLQRRVLLLTSQTKQIFDAHTLSPAPPLDFLSRPKQSTPNPVSDTEAR